MNNNINKSDIKEKKKHKFNIVDFLILLLIVAIVGTAIYAVFAWSDIKALWSTSSKEIKYIVELREVDKDFVDNMNIEKNNIVIDSVSKNQLGTVDDISSEPCRPLSYKIENGSPVGDRQDDSSKYNITIYISATAEYEKGVGYTVNGTRIAVGEILQLRFPQFASTAYCTHISES